MKEQTIIKANKKYFFFLLLLSILICAFCIGCLLLIKPINIFMAILSVILAIFSLFGVSLATYRLVGKTPFITIDKTQIIDHSRITKMPPVKWEQVEGIYLHSFGQGELVLVVLKDSYEYLQDVPGIYGKFLHSLAKKGLFWLDFNHKYTTLSKQELYDTLKGYFDEFNNYHAQ